eukprot:gene16607-22687_t
MQTTQREQTSLQSSRVEHRDQHQPTTLLNVSDYKRWTTDQWDSLVHKEFFSRYIDVQMDRNRNIHAPTVPHLTQISKDELNFRYYYDNAQQFQTLLTTIRELFRKDGLLNQESPSIEDDVHKFLLRVIKNDQERLTGKMSPIGNHVKALPKEQYPKTYEHMLDAMSDAFFTALDKIEQAAQFQLATSFHKRKDHPDRSASRDRSRSRSFGRNPNSGRKSGYSSGSDYRPPIQHLRSDSPHPDRLQLNRKSNNNTNRATCIHCGDFTDKNSKHNEKDCYFVKQKHPYINKDRTATTFAASTQGLAYAKAYNGLKAFDQISEMKHWPIPNIKNLLMKLLGQRRPKFFVVMDLTSGYYQAALDAISKVGSAFITHKGIYHWTRVTMGLKGAPSYFQQHHINSTVLGDLKDAVDSYLDDIVVAGGTAEEFLANLRRTFQRLKDKNVTLNWKKCKLGVGRQSRICGAYDRRRRLIVLRRKIE